MWLESAPELAKRQFFVAIRPRDVLYLAQPPYVARCVSIQKDGFVGLYVKIGSCDIEEAKAQTNMSTPPLFQDLHSIDLPLASIFLDPNNPRFVNSNWIPFQEVDYEKPDVQESVQRRLVKDFEVEKLRMNMEVNGYSRTLVCLSLGQRAENLSGLALF
jgi:hypothetical protein